MKTIIWIPIIAFVAITTWTWTQLHMEAKALALGITLGILAIVPAVLLIIVAAQERPPYQHTPQPYEDDDDKMLTPMKPKSHKQIIIVNQVQTVPPTHPTERWEYDEVTGYWTITYPTPVEGIIRRGKNPPERRFIIASTYPDPGPGSTACVHLNHVRGELQSTPPWAS